jgi:hypothetical protein
VIRQRNPANGQIRILGEVVKIVDDPENETLEQMGATAFGKHVGRYVKEEFPGAEVHPIVRVDPASAAGERATGADPSWRQNFQKGLREELGPEIKVKKSQVHNNRLDERLQAVRDPMLTLCEGGQPGFIICPVRCKYLRKGFKGMYVIQRTSMQGGMGRYADAPIKNDYSHVHDANQYGCVDEKRGDNDNDEDGGVTHPGAKKRPTGRREVKVESSYSVTGGNRR